MNSAVLCGVNSAANPIITMKRRQFLQTTAALSVPMFVPAAVLGRQGETAPSEKIVMGLIGSGDRGTDDMRHFLAFPQVQMIAVCDPVKAHRENAKSIVNRKYSNSNCLALNDFRELLNIDKIDAVLIATPDHWHCPVVLEACKKGKDIFCEKPETLTVKEGRQMVDAVKQYSRVFSGGSQRVLDDYGDIPRLIWSGAIGEVKEVFVDCGGPSGDCNLEEQPVPEGVDWNMWIGPAPMRPFHEKLIKGEYRPYRDFSGGGMTDWGAHRFGAAMFATQQHHTGPVEIIPPDGKDVKELTYVFKNGMKMYHSHVGDIVYKGTEGSLPNGDRKTLEKFVDVPGYSGKGGLFGDFLDCVKTRKKPFRDIETAHRAVTVCHLGNIAYWLNRPLRWDPETETIIDDEAASRWLSRPSRAWDA